MQPASQFCDGCGTPNNPQAKFCVRCGKQLAGLPPLPVQPSPLQPGQGQVSSSLTGRLNTHHLLKQRYRVLGPAGKGGMGAVYKAEDSFFGNAPRAVKEMSQSGLNPQELRETTELFKHEAILLAGLMHQNLPRIYDHFQDGERWYLVMDYVEGETLQGRLDKAPNGKLSVEEVCAIALQLCTVLDYLHSRPQPIIFRDLKPANIMLTTDDHLYLIDFGIARLFKPGQFRDTVAMISPGYAAPEQYGQVQTDARADIYSLGATLHHLLSGSHSAQHPFMFLPLQLNSHPASAELATLLMQMVELDRDKRPASMSLIKKTLQRLVPQMSMPIPIVQPVIPIPPSPVIPVVAPTVVATQPQQQQPIPPPKPQQQIVIVSAWGEGHYKSISEAIKQAKPHTRILVRPGLYQEGLVLDKPLEIIGDGPRKDIIIESRSTNCLQMQTDEALVQGLTLCCRSSRETDSAASIGQGRLVLQDCDLSSKAWACVWISGPTAKPVLRKCHIHDGKGGGVVISNEGAGTLEDCDIFGNALFGVSISAEGNLIVRQCRINRNESTGIRVHDQGKGTVEDCDLTKNGGKGAWDIDAGCVVQRRRNVE